MHLTCPRCRRRFDDPDQTRCPRDGSRLLRDRAGSRLDRWLLDGLLGVGAAGSVWRAREADAPPVALKLLAATSPAEAQRFERGARLVQELAHPNIARTLTHGRIADADGTPLLFVVMELLEGETLAAAQARVRRFDVLAAVRIADDVLAALEHAHGRDVVHRDLKSSNLFLDASGAVKLLDFGIAKVAGASSVPGPYGPEESAPHAEEVTGQHKICGTPEYMAPEQILGRPADPRSDLYSVGIVLYKALTGQLPFRGRARSEIYHQHLHDAPPPIHEDMGVPQALADAVMTALAKRPEDRFQGARAMRNALRAAVDLPAVTTPEPDLTPIPPTPLPGPMPAAQSDASTPAQARSRRTTGQRVAVAFFVVSVVVLVTVVATKLVIGP